MSEHSPANRRQFVRVVPEPLAPVRVDITGTNFFDICKAFDISEGGVRIMVPHAFEGCEIDKRVELRIHLPDPVNSAITATGDIRHTGANTFGVRFDTLEKDAAELLRRYIGAWLRRNEGLIPFVRYTLDPDSKT